MSDAYQQACERKAAQYAALRAEGLYNDTDIRPSGNSHGGTLPITDAQLDRRIDDRIWNALRDEFAPQINRAFDNLVDEANDALNGWFIEMVRELIDQKVGELKAEVEILRSVVKASNVEQLVRKTNVA